MAGIYIHIPFCRQACSYCDFHFSTSLKAMDALIGAIRKEIILRKDYLQAEKISTIYFGGGTPSLADTAKLKSIIDEIYNSFEVDAGAEITLEANPDDLSELKTEELINAGVNRLSIGIQSFSDDDLRFMNRAHDSSQALSSITNSIKAGFKNLSIDLIYGLPLSNGDQWKRNLDTAFSLGVDHLSCYSLTIEPKTALADMIRKKKVAAPEDEKSLADFELLMDESSKAGFEHYEISNFARNKNYSKHNTSYWQGKKYLGLGPSAHSYDGLTRQWNVSNNNLYVRSLENGQLQFEREVLTSENKFNEYILTSLRTMWGIDVSEIESRFGENRKKDFLNQVDLYVREGKVIRDGDKFILSREGKFLADGIAAELFG